MTRLNTIEGLAGKATLPGYDRDAHGVGIVHLGMGAFHRAHQAIYTDDALAKSGGDWRIMGVSLRSKDVPEQLNPQNGLYTAIIRGEGEPELRIIGSVAGVIFAPEEATRLLDTLTVPATRIVSLTITEKGYGLDTKTGGLDENHPAIKADLGSDLAAPKGAVGLIVAALRKRRDGGTAPFTVLCCDNLSNNGKVVKKLVLAFARRTDAALADWIEANVTFPSTMVDRITPASTERTFTTIRDGLGLEDKAATETEPFTQWIIEDDFCNGRPDWEAGGAVMVADVAPYENMKLRMLNGAHSMLAYSGFLSGHTYVRDVMTDPKLVSLIRRHMQAASATLAPVPGIDLEHYANELLERFANPSIAHETYQIAMDGTQKLPQRIFEPAEAAREKGAPLEPFAFATAAWMAYAKGKKADGQSFALRDPREAEIAAAISAAGDEPRAIAAALLDLPGLVPAGLRSDEHFRELVSSRFERFLTLGAAGAIAAEI
jgi:fructuronate reductase